MLAVFFFLFLLTAGASSEGNCSYQDVLNYLDLTHNNDLFSMTRPVRNHTSATTVHLDVLLYAILEMKEKDQIFVPYVWITMWWQNEYIGWNPNKFCGITTVSVPNKLMWKPDLTIEEMTEKDKAPPTPYLAITHQGNVELTNDQVLVSTCRMHVYKFPFDTQSCDLSFKSVIHSVEELTLVHYSNSSEATEDSREVMRTQSEWLFINMTVKSKTVNYYSFNQSMVVYTINMKRRSALYIINFILPVLFFLCLDLASFMISHRGGEKLSFKVTVLLAVTVLQLILNEILPASSNRIPLIAIYCIGIFALMLLSLLETILVMHLMAKDQHLSEDGGDKDGKDNLHSRFREIRKLIHCTCCCGASPGKTQSELLPAEKEGDGSQLAEEHPASDELTDDLNKAMKTLTMLLSSRREEANLDYWTRTAKKINKVFFVFYVMVVSLFLLYMFSIWSI